VSVTGVVMLDMGNFAVFLSPLATALSLTIWGAVLGLTAILVGTLSDECTTRAIEAREAHVGVVEVLARYLQCGNPNLQSRAMRMAELSEKVAKAMRLSEKEVDDIRVATLLMDIENIEITSRVIRKAVGALEEEKEQNTFAGSELVQSLGNVLTSAFPLLLNQFESGEVAEVGTDAQPIGARILRTVRAYDDLVQNNWGGTLVDTQEALDELKSDIDAEHHPAVLYALEKVLMSSDKPTTGESKKSDEELASV
jgi:response regulator RpfG family c-di-GMP phosphodiesterase